LAVLTVIVVNWNGRHLLAECLGSVCAQTLKDIDICLVDNGSSDGSGEYVREAFPSVRIIPLSRNFGFSAACNRAIEASASPLVALLNNDAVAEPGWAEQLLLASNEPRTGIVASKVILYMDRERLDSAGDGMTTVGVGFKRGHLGMADQYAKTEHVFGASGCAMLLRRSMLDDIGLLDEDFFFSVEDSDLCFRAQLRGWKCVYSPEALVYHKLNASIGKMSRAYVYYGQRNVEYLYFKNMPGVLLWKYLPAHLVNTGLAMIYFSSRGRPLAFLQSKLDFVRAFKTVLRKRRETQLRRTVSCNAIEDLLEKKWLRSRIAGK
jgi:hypothetical protein